MAYLKPGRRPFAHEKCKRIVEDIETQIKTLAMGSQVPKAPGLYLMYYNKLFGTKFWESYITEQLNTKWPNGLCPNISEI